MWRWDRRPHAPRPLISSSFVFRHCAKVSDRCRWNTRCIDIFNDVPLASCRFYAPNRLLASRINTLAFASPLEFKIFAQIAYDRAIASPFVFSGIFSFTIYSCSAALFQTCSPQMIVRHFSCFSAPAIMVFPRIVPDKLEPSVAGAIVWSAHRTLRGRDAASQRAQADIDF